MFVFDWLPSKLFPFVVESGTVVSVGILSVFEIWGSWGGLTESPGKTPTDRARGLRKLSGVGNDLGDPIGDVGLRGGEVVANGSTDTRLDGIVGTVPSWDKPPVVRCLGISGRLKDWIGGSTGLREVGEICKGGSPPPSDVVAPSVSTSLVLVTFSSEEVIGDTLLINGLCMGPLLGPNIFGRGGGASSDILRFRGILESDNGGSVVGRRTPGRVLPWVCGDIDCPIACCAYTCNGPFNAPSTGFSSVGDPRGGNCLLIRGSPYCKWKYL